ncbi:MAG: hypothetical protein ACR2KU_03675 [Gammaproteobacteria bacterium]
MDFHFGEDRIDFKDVNSAQIIGEFGNTIEAGDDVNGDAVADVTNVNGDLVINFGPTAFPGFGVLTVEDAGFSSLLVGSDVV